MDSFWQDGAIDVDTGEVKVIAKHGVLRSVALGSCVAVIIYDKTSKIGGIAHIMLPGKSFDKTDNITKFCDDALDILFDKVMNMGSKTDNLEISVVGGANVLQEGDTPDKVVKSVLEYLSHKKSGDSQRKIGRDQKAERFFLISAQVNYFTLRVIVQLTSFKIV